jgi:hypothetical protein
LTKPSKSPVIWPRALFSKRARPISYGTPVDFNSCSLGPTNEISGIE